MISIDELMTRNPFTLGPDDSLERAGELMKEHRIRHLPIVDDGNVLLGLVTQRDLLAAAVSERSNYTTGDVMRRKVYTVEREDNLRVAALMMQTHKIGSLLVVNDRHLEGIITDTDYVGLAITLLEQMEELESGEFDLFSEPADLDSYAEDY